MTDEKHKNLSAHENHLLKITKKLALKYTNLSFSNKNYLEQINKSNFLYIREKNPNICNGDLFEIRPFMRGHNGKYRVIIAGEIYRISDEIYLEPDKEQPKKRKHLLFNNFTDFDLLNYLDKKLFEFFDSQVNYRSSLEE